MGSSSYNAQPGDGAFRPADDQSWSSRHGDQRPPSPESYRELLDEVLKQTLLSRDDQTRQRLESLDELLEVARRRRGEAFTLDPIGIELVQTVLRTPFRALLASEDQWHEMTDQIARTLCEDPVAYDRLSTLWRRLGKGAAMGTKTTQELIVSCQGLVRSLAWKIHCKLPKSVDLDDLVSYGQVGLAEAARDYEEGRGNFTTYAYYRVRGAILDGLSKMRWFNQVDYHRGKYEQMGQDVLYAEEGGGQAQGGGDLEDDVRWLKSVSNALATVYMFCHSGDEQTGGAGSVEDRSVASPPTTLLKQEVHEKLHQLVNSLPADAAALIRGAYFEGLSLKEAGERIGISKAWASRLHAKTLGQLARSLEDMQLAD